MVQIKMVKLQYDSTSCLTLFGQIIGDLLKETDWLVLAELGSSP